MEKNRFKEVHRSLRVGQDGKVGGAGRHRVFRDEMTGVLYLETDNGVTPLLDSDGKPIVEPVEAYN